MRLDFAYTSHRYASKLEIYTDAFTSNKAGFLTEQFIDNWKVDCVEVTVTQ